MLNMDFTQPVIIDTEAQPWLPSPAAGVERKPLARQDAESGHATSIVRYAAGARFKSHPHPLGEEILVLDGVFSDEHGDYPAGTYIRNPDGSSHAPFSTDGCTLFVKLYQIQPGDDATVRTNMHNALWTQHVDGYQLLELHRHQEERVCLIRWTPSATAHAFTPAKDAEILVLNGALRCGDTEYSEGHWLRLPEAAPLAPAQETETLIWLKQGHLERTT